MSKFEQEDKNKCIICSRTTSIPKSRDDKFYNFAGLATLLIKFPPHVNEQDIEVRICINCFEIFTEVFGATMDFVRHKQKLQNRK